MISNIFIITPEHNWLILLVFIINGVLWKDNRIFFPFCCLRNMKNEIVFQHINKQQKWRRCLMKETRDLRITKTKQLLRDALLMLIREVGFENITIKKLTESAQVNRSTFYAHFYDKYDLLEKTINEELTSFAEFVAPKSEEELLETDIPKTLFSRATQYIYEHSDFFKVMMGVNGIPAFQQQFIQIMKRYMTDRLERFHP